MNHVIQGVTGYFFISNSHPIFNIRDADAFLVLQIPNECSSRDQNQNVFNFQLTIYIL